MEHTPLSMDGRAMQARLLADLGRYPRPTGP